MKYNFDEVVDRINELGSYSIKWADNKIIRNFFGTENPLPTDRISFFTADMDYRCSPAIQKALMEVAKHNIYGYSSPNEEYYDAVINWFSRRFDWKFNRDSIFLCHGTHDGISQLIKKFSKPGDGIILLTPSYPYDSDVEPLGRKLVKVPMIEKDCYYTIDFEALSYAAKQPSNTMIILIQPHNPTGRIFTENEIQKIGKICEDNGVLIVSDEVHIDLTRDGNKILPVMKVLGPKNVITTTAVNKTFNLAGLAMSNIIIENPSLQEKMGRAFVGASPFGIAAVIAAYNESEDWLDNLNKYMDNLMHHAVDRIHSDLPKVRVIYPEATYVLWLDFRDYSLNNTTLDNLIFNEAHIMVSGGESMDMDQLPKTQMRRICLTSSKAVFDEAMDRLKIVFKDYNK